MTNNLPPGWLGPDQLDALLATPPADPDLDDDSGFGAWDDLDPPLLDEPALRSEGWSGFRPVTLGDGQTWWLPQLGLVEVMALPDLDGLIMALPDLGDPPAFGPSGAPCALDVVEFLDRASWHDLVVDRIAARLLGLNYTLHPVRIRGLVGSLFLSRPELEQAVVDVLEDSGQLRSIVQPGWASDRNVFNN